MRISPVSKRPPIGATLILACLVALTLTLGAQQRGSTPSIQGTWRVVEITTTGPNGTTNSKPQPGLRLFTGKYYSITLVQGTDVRPNFKDPAKVTPDEALAVWQPFAANAGTYEIKGNEIIYKRIVAKNPAVMRAGNSASDTFRFEGKDTLWLVEKTNQDGAIQNPSTYKLIRVE